MANRAATIQLYDDDNNNNNNNNIVQHKPIKSPTEAPATAPCLSIRTDFVGIKVGNNEQRP